MWWQLCVCLFVCLFCLFSYQLTSTVIYHFFAKITFTHTSFVDNGDKQVSTTTKTTTNRPPSRPSSRKSLQRTSSIENQKQCDNSASSGKKSEQSVRGDRPPSRPSSRKSLQRTSSHENVRQSHSAGSSGKKPASVAVNGDVRKVMAENDGRSSSAEARIERSDSPKKQVFLPSVRRNYEQ